MGILKIFKDMPFFFRRRRYTCPECKVKEGELHVRGCEFDRCPECGGFLEMFERFGTGCDHKINDDKRHPYVHFPYICRRCGEKYPEMFWTNTRIWKRYMPMHSWDEMICPKCWAKIIKFSKAIPNASTAKDMVFFERGEIIPHVCECETPCTTCIK